MKKLITFLLMFTMISAITASAVEASQDKPEVTVEVIAGTPSEADIANIEFDDGTKVGDYDFEVTYVKKVTRDPAYISYYFNSAMWITRDGVVSLSLAPTDRVRKDSTLRESGWNILKSSSTGLGGNANWPKTSAAQQCFYWQYLCHWQFANAKDYWNIEPSRSASSYASVVAHGCNP